MPKKKGGDKPISKRVPSADIPADTKEAPSESTEKRASALQPRTPENITDKQTAEQLASALQPRTSEDIANEQTAERLALFVWAAMIGKTLLSDMSALVDELLTSSLFDDDDEEGDDEGWLDDHHEREKKILDEAITDRLDKFPDINAINNLPPSSDPEIVQAAGQLRDVLAKCAIGATEFKKFPRAQLERMLKLDLTKRFKKNPKYSEHVRGDVPGSSIKKYGSRSRTSTKGTFVKTNDYASGGGLDTLLTGGWLRVAKDRIDPVAWSHQFGFERKTERQSWLQHFVITERNGKQSPFELPREKLTGTGALAIRELRKAGVLIVRRGVVQKALVQHLDFKPKLEIIRMPQVGFFAVAAADNARDPDQYGHQVKGTTADWQKKVAIPLRGNSNVALALATSFASALIPFTDEQRGGVHLHGTTGIGKTLVLAVGESVYGLPGASEHPRAYGRKWAITPTGLEDLLRFRNHAGLFLDDIQRAPRELRPIVVQMIYAFTQMPKVRGGSWRLRSDGFGQMFLLSSGEDSIATFVGKEEDRLGRERRMPDIPAEVVPGSAFETIDHDALQEKLPALYRVVIKECHGAPGRDWQRWLVELGAVKIRERIDRERQAFLALPQVQNIWRRAQSELRSVIRRFALYAASLHLAIEASILLWTGEEADAGLIACLGRWVQQRGTADPAIAQSQFITDFKRKLADDLSDRFIHIHKVKGRSVPATDSDAAKQQNSPTAYDGYVKDGKDGEDELVLIRPGAFEKRCAGANPVEIARRLYTMGDLLASDKDGKLSKTVQTIGRSERFYVLRRTALVLPDTPDTPDTPDPGK